MKNGLCIIFLMLFIFSCSRNNTKTVKSKGSNIEIVPPQVINPKHYDIIGFKCGEAGQETTLVSEFAKLIKHKNYERLKASLHSSKPGEVYLSTISCEKLALKNIMKLNSLDIKQIKKNRNATDTINTCSGCTEFGYFTVKQLLGDTSNYISLEARWWFDEILETNIIEK